MSTPAGWHKHPRGTPCPVCGSGVNPRRANTLCMASDDGRVVCCGKADGAAWGGRAPFKRGGRLWSYWADPGAANMPRQDRPERPARRVRRLPFDRLFAGWWRAAGEHADWLAGAAAELGLTVASLDRLRVGWATADRRTPDAEPLIVGTPTRCGLPGAWVFPLRQPDGSIAGARVRTGSGGKYAVTTSDGDGILAPSGLRPGRTLLLPEGPTSAAALLDLGFDAIGRPANYGGAAAILGYARRLRPRRVLVVADNDERFNPALGRTQWPGREGAESVAAALAIGGLRRAGVPVDVVHPPAGVKDARDWLAAGATAADVRGLWGRATSARRAS